MEYLLSHGMFTRTHQKAEPGYINIGDSNLIQQRNNYPVGINPPGGYLGDYIPFYFGPLSPMLLNIKTGYRGITMRPQSEIVYVCCKLDDVVQQCGEWCFTDGHAKNLITKFYNDLSNIDEVDWDMVSARYWQPQQSDYDRMRRKQAEFLVKDYVPVSCIRAIVVFNSEKSKVLEEIINRLGLNITVVINPNNQFYY
jgi:hypothetical protein